MNPRILKIPTIAVTGSVGKTTTKEMIASVLNVKWNVLKTLNNRNQINHTKECANKVRFGHQSVVLEFAMGRKDAGKMHCNYIQPNISVITNVGAAHYGKLGNSIQSTAKYKSDLIKYMKPNGILLLNSDDKNSKLLNTKKFKGKIITVGVNNKADYQASDVKFLDSGMTFQLILKHKKEKFFIPAFGIHNVINALFAIVVAHLLHFSPSEIRSGLKNFKIPDRRLTLLKLRSQSLLIDDTYNSNPESVKAAVDVFIELSKGKKKIVVLGSMLELGQRTNHWHKEIGEYLSKKNICIICTYGKEAKFINIGAVKTGHKKAYHFLKRKKLHLWLKQNIQPSTAILIKGSNRMRMNETVNYILRNYSK